MQSKTIYISYLRILATIFVIAIHASTGYLNKFSADFFDWNYANWINSFTRCAVPIFVALSGALLLPKEENLKIFYSKRIPKLLYPFIFWTIIYLIYHFYRYTNWEVLSTDQIIDISFSKLAKGTSVHLWYLYMILGLYLTFPFLKKLLHQLSIKEIEIFLIFWLISMLITNKSINNYLPRLDFTFFSGYIGYAVLGYYLTIKSLNWSKYYNVLGYVVVGVFTALATYYLSASKNKYEPFYYNYVFINTALATFFIFCWAKKQFKNTVKINPIFKIIDDNSFGIYLVHIIPLNYLHPQIAKQVSTLWVIPLATFATLIASIGIIILLKKIPFLKNIVT